MNEINFEMQDVEKIDLSMDVGVKTIFPPIENLEVTPTKEQQVFNHENSYGYDKVTIEPIPSEYIIPDGTLEVASNGDVDVTNYKLARVGVYTPPTLQDKSITITENGTQNITFDEGYDGLNSVEVTTNIESGGGGKYAPSFISFYGYTGTNLDYELENLDLSNLTTLSNMFYNCTKLKEITLNNVNVPLTGSTQGMFYSCSSLETLNISGWNVPLLTDTRNMFMMCSKLKIINIKNWNTPKLTSLYSTFSSCSQLQEVDFTGWDMSNVTNMRGTFGSCSQLKSVIFPQSFNGSKVTNMLSLFNNCSSLQHIDMRNCDFSNVTSSGSMFNNVPVDCEIIVKDDTAKSFVLTQRSDFTNVKTVAEL